jgi:hypothetical protein
VIKGAELRDPAVCKDCHPQQYAEWSGSMHAYASDDPVFTAMNKRGQRETGGALGDFCVKCHAPMAVHEGQTTDGLNLASLPAPMHGVTCYFCHAAESVDTTIPHNNPLELVTDDRLFGPFGDPVGETPHNALYSPLFDETRAESAAACGTCHDIVNSHGAAIERTYQEWQGSLFSSPNTGLTCASSCHMSLPISGPAPASEISPERKRDLHSHAFPGVDVALTAFPQADAQKQQIQELQDTAVHATVCLDSIARKIWVIIDNAGGGHGFPSGAAQDRRAWVEVSATLNGQPVYQSGVPVAGQPLESAADPDLWLMRDCIYDDAGQPVHMFWEATSFKTNQLPAPVPSLVSDPTSFNKSHIKRIYPDDSATLTDLPDSISVKVHIKAIGDDVIQDLVASGDLDPALASQIATFDLGNGGVLEWTPQTAKTVVLPGMGDVGSCVKSYTSPLRIDTPNLDTTSPDCAAR